MYTFQRMLISCICIGAMTLGIGCDVGQSDAPRLHADDCGDGTPSSLSQLVRIRSEQEIHPGIARYILRLVVSAGQWEGLGYRCFNANRHWWANTINVNWCHDRDSELFHLERRTTDGAWRLRGNEAALNLWWSGGNRCITHGSRTLHFAACDDNDDNQKVEIEGVDTSQLRLKFGGEYARLAYPQPSAGFSPIRNHVALDSSIVEKHRFEGLYGWVIEEEPQSRSQRNFNAAADLGDEDADNCPDELDTNNDGLPADHCGRCEQNSCEGDGMCLQMTDGRHVCVYPTEQCPSGGTSVSVPGIADSSVCYTVSSGSGSISLTPGPVDVDGDGTPDIKFVVGTQNAFLDRLEPYGLVGNIGGGPGTGAAWVRDTSTVVTPDGQGRNEIIKEFRGALLNSDNNWSKVHFSSGDGWVQWEIGEQSSIVRPVAFIRENPGENLSASQAAARK